MKAKKERHFILFRRGFMENIASLIIGIGVFMFMQPFSMSLYSHSFKFILTGTIAFLFVSHFPQQ